MYISDEIIEFFKDPQIQILINKDTKESWEEIYDSYSYLKAKKDKDLQLLNTILGVNKNKSYQFRNLTELLLSVDIEPCKKLNYIPEGYLYKSHIKIYNVPNNCEYIGEGAFSFCKHLKSIYLPNTIKYIGEEAFFECESIEKIIIPDGCEEICKCAFWGCKKLKHIEIPHTIKKLNYSIFNNCPELKEILFKGTIHQWENILKPTLKYGHWNSGNNIQKIICTDGEIIL